MDPKETARTIAQAVQTLAALDPEARRHLLTGLYKELQAEGLDEPAAAAIQHQLARAAEGLGAPTVTASLDGATQPAGQATRKKG